MPSIKQVLPTAKTKEVRTILFVLLFHTVERQHSLPPGGRGTAIAVEGARVTFIAWIYCHALSLSRLRCQLPPVGAFLCSSMSCQFS